MRIQRPWATPPGVSTARTRARRGRLALSRLAHRAIIAATSMRTFRRSLSALKPLDDVARRRIDDHETGAPGTAFAPAGNLGMPAGLRGHEEGLLGRILGQFHRGIEAQRREHQRAELAQAQLHPEVPMRPCSRSRCRL
ncbi:MAG: hypothetical protein IPG91_13240 [Ideonella sp.]|nr:hypothetical protein [Ideonella sp.]